MTRIGRTASSRDPRGVLAITSFRRLWIALSLSSLGDWLSILALIALAADLTSGQSYAVQSYAVGGVLIVQLVPAVVFGPLAGALADRFNRRYTMVVTDVLRFGLFLSIPLVGRLDWLLVAAFVSQVITLFWTPAKEATVPNLVPRDRLEAANQLSLFTTYGSAPVASGLFTLLALASSALGAAMPFFRANPADLALYFNALTFLVSGITIFTLRDIPPLGAKSRVSVPSVLREIFEGWTFVGRTRVIRGLVIGIVGAFASGAAVIGISRVYVDRLGGGDPAFGVVFGAVFLGMALGMFLGPRILRDFSRRRLFALALVWAGLALLFIALIPNLVMVVFMSVALGAGAGISWVTGYTMIGLEVEDQLRGRTFAFLQSLSRVVLLLVIAVVPFLAGLFGAHRFQITPDVHLVLDGSNAVLFIAAVLAVGVGVLAFRQIDDRKGVPLLKDLLAAVRGEPYVPPSAEPQRGMLIAFEGGEGAGKTTQSRLLAIWLRDQGYDVVTTQEPGATKVGMRVRAILLDQNHSALSSRSETLLYAADRAEHVASVIQPALQRGAIVVTDRFADSSLAYQGAGRSLPVEEISRVNRWATGGVTADLTIVLDVPASVGLGRFASPADRIESEPHEFHERVRRGFLALAETEPHLYLVVDGSQPSTEISKRIQGRVREILPDPVPSMTEDATHTFPAIKE